MKDTKNRRGEGMIEKCPVCLGNGIVPNGFYSTTNQQQDCLIWTSSGTEPEICRSCNGKGYIVVEPLTEKKPVSFGYVEE